MSCQYICRPMTGSLTSATLISKADSSLPRKSRGCSGGGSEAAPAMPANCARLLYGSFEDLGVCIKVYDVQQTGAGQWSRALQGGGIELCLNLIGNGSISSGEK